VGFQRRSRTSDGMEWAQWGHSSGPRLNAKLYETSIGTRCATSVCSAVLGGRKLSGADSKRQIPVDQIWRRSTPVSVNTRWK
jgi:hypothetical protein